MGINRCKRVKLGRDETHDTKIGIWQEEWKMDRTKEKEVLDKLGKKASVDILRFVVEHGKGRYKDFQPFGSTYTINARIKDLTQLDLIQHKFVKEEVRKEWYESTERGRKVTHCLDDLGEVMEE